MFGQVFSARPQNVSDLFLSGLTWLLQVPVAEGLQLKKLFSPAVSKLPVHVRDRSVRHHLVWEEFCLNKLVEELIHLPISNEDFKSDFVGPMHQFLSLGHCELQKFLCGNAC